MPLSIAHVVTVSPVAAIVARTVFPTVASSATLNAVSVTVTATSVTVIVIVSSEFVLPSVTRTVRL